MNTYTLQTRVLDGDWSTIINGRTDEPVVFPRPIEACAEAQRIADWLQTPVRVVETVVSVLDTCLPQEQQPHLRLRAVQV